MEKFDKLIIIHFKTPCKKLLQNIIEEHDCFKAIDPENNKRPDIFIFNANALGFDIS
jgi:hypothetical protein